MDEQCPGCDVVITPANAGGYRTFCGKCVHVFPSLPKVGGFVIEGRFPSFMWVPVDEDGTRTVPVFDVDESLGF